MNKFLMNPNEQFKISIVVDGLGKPDITLRIIEGEPIKQYSNQRKASYYIENFFLGSLGAFAILILGALVIVKPSSILIIIAVIIVLAVGFFIMNKMIDVSINRSIQQEQEEFPE